MGELVNRLEIVATHGAARKLPQITRQRTPFIRSVVVHRLDRAEKAVAKHAEPWGNNVPSFLESHHREPKILIGPGISEDEFDAIPATEIPINLLLVTDSPRMAGVNAEHARMLAQLDVPLPAILVRSEDMRVIDGIHRLRAAELRGESVIRAKLINCSERDAFVLSVRCNIRHGLPLTLADRKAAARQVLLAHPAWSDRVVGDVTGISHKTVGAIRRKSTGEIPQSTSRVGKDGRVRSVVRRSPSTATPHRSGLPDTLAPGRQQAHLSALMRDPALKLSETGRALLRLLSTRAVDPADWQGILCDVPEHCTGTVAELAAHYATTWKRFTDELRKKSSAT